MNNLFRITQDNLNDFFIEYKKNKTKKIDNKTTKNINMFKSKYNKNMNKKNNNIIEYNNDKLEQNIFIPSQIKKNLNYELKNTNTEIYTDNNTKNINTHVDNTDEKKNNNKTNKIDLERKIILEYGKSGIKLDQFKKIMKKNLLILFKIDDIIRNFLNLNPKINLNNLIKNELNNGQENNLLNLKKIHHNREGEIFIESNKFFNVILHKKKDNNIINKKYNLINFGFVKLFDINFTDDFLHKNKIPSFNSIINFSENKRHFLKLIKLLEYTDKYKIKINQLNGNFDFEKIFYKNLPLIILNLNEKKNTFNSPDKNFSFYIKITGIDIYAFILDKKEKLIHFFNTIETKKSGFILFYTLRVNNDYKIINLNKKKK